ncbi:hypothetical protein MMC30_005709 [Trapelia coarctata]|nr:hypothetical protein [Trapelia coarctata]
MASVFTFDPDPPRVSSPWSTPPVTTPRIQPEDADDTGYQFGGLIAPQPAHLADCGISKLEAEPQDGPTEYKLHLLLRPRRSFTSSSTGRFVSGSNQSRSKLSGFELHVSTKPETSTPAPAPSFQTRQNRLQHLTTQLLWRLQQSSPYHSSSAANLVLPVLPETALKLVTPPKPGKLLPGLEESRGALYEIGVSDDGTFVGLTKDELDESLLNLRAMAASLGCRVEILRTVIVGTCEWVSIPTTGKILPAKASREKLWVAEVLVIPDTHQSHREQSFNTPLSNANATVTTSGRHQAIWTEEESPTEQLRISLTGSTTSGKSSLLGTLSTSTLDNGRGKSRLSLLKHRHEIATGVTSSVAPELIGYQVASGEKSFDDVELSVVNYGCGNVSSWNDIHTAAEGRRLVFLIDSAGHPRYRRTTVRGLVSWAPHWTICCVASDDCEDTTGKLGSTASARDILGPAGAGIDLSKAHLELCLKLDLSLVVVITKYDIASRGGLRQTLAKILSIVKAAGRQPVVLAPTPHPGSELDLQALQHSHEDEVKAMLSPYGHDASMLVPIVITSAVTGSGINKLHALLSQLPIPKSARMPYHPSAYVGCTGVSPSTLFHLDEIFTRSGDGTSTPAYDGRLRADSRIVLSGHLRYGNLCLGDKLYIGPFTPESTNEDPKLEMHRARSYPGQLSGNFPSTPPRLQRRPLSGDYTSGGARPILESEWQLVQVTSIRNLRLPVQRLLAGQVGTVGIEFMKAKPTISSKVRKGMVLARSQDGDILTACGGFRALFDDKDYLSMEPGQLYSTHIASIRASAKIITVEAIGSTADQDADAVTEVVGHVFEFDESTSEDGGVKLPEIAESNKQVEVTFQFVTYREWVEVGTQVLVMPGNGAEGSVGLEGFAGRVTRVLD